MAWPREEVMVLGRGPARAAAEMAALTLKEAVGLPAEALETGQFRHGPLELAGPGLAAIVIATEPETVTLDRSLAQELRDDGAVTMEITRGDGSRRSLGPAVGSDLGDLHTRCTSTSERSTDRSRPPPRSCPPNCWRTRSRSPAVASRARSSTRPR